MKYIRHNSIIIMIIIIIIIIIIIKQRLTKFREIIYVGCVEK